MRILLLIPTLTGAWSPRLIAAIVRLMRWWKPDVVQNVYAIVAAE